MSFINSFGFSQIGLILDIVGVLGLFYFGPPTINLTKDGNVIPPFQIDDPVKKTANQNKFKKHQWWSRTFLTLILLGFIFQFMGGIPNIPS